MFQRRFNRMIAVSPQQMQRMANYQNTMPTATDVAAHRKEVQAKQASVTRDIYVEIEVKNTSATQELPFVLFDAIGAYADQQNFTQSGNVSITGVSKSYALIMRKLLTGKFILKDLHLETLAGKQSQFSRSVSIWDDNMEVDTVSIIKTIYPSKGRNSMQENLNLVELKGINKTFDAGSSLTSTILPQNTYTFRLFMTEVKLS